MDTNSTFRILGEEKLAIMLSHSLFSPWISQASLDPPAHSADEDAGLWFSSTRREHIHSPESLSQPKYI